MSWLSLFLGIFDGILNGIAVLFCLFVFLQSLSDISLLV
jgi:hypothetical protein